MKYRALLVLACSLIVWNADALAAEKGKKDADSEGRFFSFSILPEAWYCTWTPKLSDAKDSNVRTDINPSLLYGGKASVGLGPFSFVGQFLVGRIQKQALQEAGVRNETRQKIIGQLLYRFGKNKITMAEVSQGRFTGVVRVADHVTADGVKDITVKDLDVDNKFLWASLLFLRQFTGGLTGGGVAFLKSTTPASYAWYEGSLDQAVWRQTGMRDANRFLVAWKFLDPSFVGKKPMGGFFGYDLYVQGGLAHFESPPLMDVGIKRQFGFTVAAGADLFLAKKWKVFLGKLGYRAAVVHDQLFNSVEKQVEDTGNGLDTSFEDVYSGPFVSVGAVF